MNALLVVLLALTPAEMKEDLHVLRQTFEDAHAGLYRYTPKAEMDAAFDAVEARLDRPMQELEFFRLLAPLIDRVHDAHTGLSPSRDTLRQIARAKVFPLDIRYIDGRAFIERNYSVDKTIPLGAEITAINGMPMAEITETILLAKMTDGFNRESKYAAANLNFWLAYYELVCDSEVFDIEVDGRVHRVAGVSPAFFDHQYKVQTHDNVALEILDDRVAILAVPHLTDLAIADTFAKSFRELREQHIQSLIIDIRDNTGGWDELNPELLTYLVPHPFRAYKGFTYRAKDWSQLSHLVYEPDDFLNAPDMNRSADEKKAIVAKMTLPEALEYNCRTNPAAGIHQPKTADLFKGDVYVLFNARSASSGGEIPAFLHFLGVGTLIGEEPNCAYEGTNAGIFPPLTLPHSKISMRVPLLAYHNAVIDGVIVGHGAPPHFVVRESVDDAIAGRDTVLAFTLELIRTRSAR